MKTNFILIFAALLFILACDSNQTTEQDDSEASYFPLQIGNQWYYEVRDDTVEIYTKVTGKTTKNGREYYVLAYVPGPGSIGQERTMYLRSPDGLKIYQYEDNAEKLYRDFSEVITDTNYTKKYITSKRDYVDLPIGRFNDIINVTDVGFERDAGGSMDYAKGVGLITAGWFKGEFYLKYANINGKEIGE